MTKARLMTNLFNYRALCARIDMLALRIREAERTLDLGGDDDIAGQQLNSPAISDMPMAHGVPSSPTERVALRLMERPASLELIALRRMIREHDELLAEKRQMDILIGSLQERERFVIMHHLVAGLKWRETGRRFQLEYDEELTENGLKYVMRQGLERMLRVGEGKAE